MDELNPSLLMYKAACMHFIRQFIRFIKWRPLLTGQFPEIVMWIQGLGFFTKRTQSYWYKDFYFTSETIIRPSKVYNRDSNYDAIKWEYFPR